ncbi:hypothetical protein LPJ70_001709 [Coemansia sp. RSA 2708]|nr:hypothetical protein LPJ70_001709 [Coemansia sp. RSA 2708]
MNFGFYMPELASSAADTGDEPASQQPTLAEIAAAAVATHNEPPSPAAKPRAAKEGAKPIGMACRACRQRKIRCGGEQPRCSYCVKKGYECVLTPHKKRGRPRKNEQRAGAKDTHAGGDAAEESVPAMTMPVDGLDLDVRQLWAELTGLQGLELPPELSALAANAAMQAQDSASIPNIGPSFTLGTADAAQQQQQQQFHAQPRLDAQAGGEDDPLAFAANYAFPKLGEAANERAASPASSSAQRSATGHGGEEAGSRAAMRAGASEPPEVDAGVHAYFAYVQPWFPILHRPTFERQVAEGRVDRLLYCAVQALAARFLDASASGGKRKRRRPWRRGQRFARRARALLPAALRQATLATLQAVALLSLHASVSGAWQEGAAYEKLAVQLAFIGQYHLLDEEFLLPPVTNNMGVYEAGWSEHSHPARLEVLSRPGGVLDHEQRRRAWWAVFQLERFNGLAMGRPPIIKPGWHWVWLPCSEALWARADPQGPLAWELGLADSAQRAPQAVSDCRVDLVLALIMGQLVEQRTEMFRLFFPRVDRGTLFYDNLPTHALGWAPRLRRLCDAVGVLERRIRQWHAELDRYADSFSARRHANFEIMGRACQIHLYAAVLQIREHLFEDVLVGAEAASLAEDDVSRPGELAQAFERQTGRALKSAYQRGYVARARRPELTLQFVRDLDTLAQRCWARSVAMADEVAGLLRTHWLRALDAGAGGDPGTADESVVAGVGDGLVDDPDLRPADSGTASSWTLGAHPARAASPAASGASSSLSSSAHLDAQVADRFKLLNPQTPYHLFVAGKVLAARLKQAVTAQARKPDGAREESSSDDGDDVVVREAVRRINAIWGSQAARADVRAIESRLDDVIAALEYAQLFWFSLNFASHLKYLKREALKPLLHGVYRE